MNRGRVSQSTLAIACMDRVPAYIWRLGFSFLALGSTVLLLVSAAFGHGQAPAKVQVQAIQVMPPAVQSFLRQNCFACHNKTTSSGGLNLAAAPFRPKDSKNLDFWVKV